jgi:hypothetical protein
MSDEMANRVIEISPFLEILNSAKLTRSTAELQPLRKIPTTLDVFG